MLHSKTVFISPARASMRCGRHQRGMTLIEWMISITIGLILLVGLAALIAQQSRTQAELDKSSRQIENGRYAMQLMQDDLQLAGYYGEYSAVDALPVPAALPKPCSVVTDPADAAYAADGLPIALPFAVHGYDSPAGLPANLSAAVAAGGCGLSGSNYVPGTDILVVRRTDTEKMIAPLKVGEIYLQSGLAPSSNMDMKLVAAPSTAIGTADFSLTTKAGTVAPLRRYLVHIYFISPCSVPANGSTCSAANNDDGGTSVPTLKRLELSVAAGAARFTMVPLVEGIENMQIDYGFDADGDGAPDTPFAKDAAAVGDWANVMAVRVNLLARNNERSVDAGTKSFTLGLEASFTPTGAFKRKVFSQLIRLTNPSSRRER